MRPFTCSEVILCIYDVTWALERANCEPCCDLLKPHLKMCGIVAILHTVVSPIRRTVSCFWMSIAVFHTINRAFHLWTHIPKSFNVPKKGSYQRHNSGAKCEALCPNGCQDLIQHPSVVASHSPSKTVRQCIASGTHPMVGGFRSTHMNRKPAFVLMEAHKTKIAMCMMLPAAATKIQTSRGC
jgi:hypothetical protein